MGGKLIAVYLYERHTHSEAVRMETERIERHKIAHAMIAEYKEMVMMKQSLTTLKPELVKPVYAYKGYGLFQRKVVVDYQPTITPTFAWYTFKSGSMVCMLAMLVGLIVVPLSLIAKLFMLCFRLYRRREPSSMPMPQPFIYDEPPPVHGWMDTPPQNFQPFQADKVKETDDDKDTTADFDKARWF